MFSSSNKLNERQRYELYVGVFRNHLWTIDSLCDYFHKLIKLSSITECHFYSCVNSTPSDCSFAILTFASISSIDQCLDKYDQIKREHRLVVKRNIRDIQKDQKYRSEYVLIHIEKFDHSFNKENVLTYFGEYGSIIQWEILDHNQTFLLKFKDYDCVDRIFLDNPHYLNGQLLSIKKCNNPYKATLMCKSNNSLKEKLRDLQAAVDRSVYLHESNLNKLKKQIQEEFIGEEKRLSDIMKLYIRLERIQRDLKQDLINARQINQQLKIQLKETIQKNGKIVDDFENQIQQQRTINQSLQESLVDFVQV